jgi:serine/threonine-protein kinase RsbW
MSTIAGNSRLTAKRILKKIKTTQACSLNAFTDQGLYMNAKKFPASLAELYNILDFIKRQAQARQFNLNQIGRIILAIEEAVINIIKHGYGEKEGEIEILCETTIPSGMKITIKDQGMPFNPLEYKHQIKPEDQLYLNKDQVGGYGIYIYLNIMDRVEYQRINETNHLSMTIYL